MDGASSAMGAGVGVIIITLEHSFTLDHTVGASF